MRKTYLAPWFELLTVELLEDVLSVSVPTDDDIDETVPQGYDPVEAPDDF